MRLPFLLLSQAHFASRQPSFIGMLSLPKISSVPVPFVIRFQHRRQIIRSPVQNAEGHSIETEVAVEMLRFTIERHRLQEFAKATRRRTAADLLAYWIELRLYGIWSTCGRPD